MSIRIKLILTYAILVMISATVLIFSGIAILTGIFSEVSDVVLVEESAHLIVTDVIDLLAELKQADEYNPESLIDPKTIEEITENTRFFNGGLVVRHENKHYNYSALPDDGDFYNQLIKTTDEQGYGKFEGHDTEHLVKHDERNYFYIDYTFEVEGEEVVYFFIVDVTETELIGQKSGQKFLGTILVILFIIMAPLLIIVTKDIIQPIKKLEYGVKHIKEGDLDFRLQTKTNNEIGKVVRYFDVMRSELKRSIEQQIKFEENRKELITSISHDLKTPITSIKGHVEGIRDGVANTPEKMEKYLSVIYQKSRDMDQLIDDLFLFSKLDLNRLPFEMKQQNLIPFMTEIYNEMALGWESDHKKMTLNIHTESPDQMMVNIDVMKIKRVFVNIIQNAMKYMDKEEEKIDINITDHDKYIQVVIGDNGQGIDEDHIHQIFNRFYRVDESRNPETGGTGLGLAISKQIIEQHDGHIFATSKVSQGTKIVIELKKIIQKNNEVE